MLILLRPCRLEPSLARCRQRKLGDDEETPMGLSYCGGLAPERGILDHETDKEGQHPRGEESFVGIPIHVPMMVVCEGELNSEVETKVEWE